MNYGKKRQTKRYCVKCKSHIDEDKFFDHYKTCIGKKGEAAKEVEAPEAVETVNEGEAAKEVERAQKDALIEQIKELGGEADRKYSIASLEEKLKQLKAD